MNSTAFNYLALLAALVVGYGVFVSSMDTDVAPVEGNVLQGYYLHDAVITETSPSGRPHIRVAAAEVKQHAGEKRVELSSLRIDYLTEPDTASEPVAHWVLNADRGVAPETFRHIQLRDNIEAHNLGAARPIVLNTQALDVDIDKQIATSRAPVDIDFDGNTAHGNDLSVDLRRDRIRLSGGGRMRLAQAERPAPADRQKKPEISLPEMFEYDVVEFRNNIWTLTKVRSITPPFVQADRARAAGANPENNQVELQGAVQIELPKQGQLTADTATVTTRDSRVVFAHVEATPGKLVEFEHRRGNSEQLVRGRAKTIDYDVANGTLLLVGDGWLQDERGEWSVDRLEYNINTEAMRGTRNTVKLNRRKSAQEPAP